MNLCYYTAAFCRRVRHHRCGPWGAGQRSGSQGHLGPVLVVWLRRSALAEGSGAPCLCPWPCHREPEGWGKHSGTQGGAGSPQERGHFPQIQATLLLPSGRLSETDARSCCLLLRSPGSSERAVGSLGPQGALFCLQPLAHCYSHSLDPSYPLLTGQAPTSVSGLSRNVRPFLEPPSLGRPGPLILSHWGSLSNPDMPPTRHMTLA